MKTPTKLLISIENMPYPVRRKVLVPEDIDMRQLHHVIQEVVGWTGMHPFQFSDLKWKGELILSSPEDVEESEWLFGDQMKVAHEYSLKAFLDTIGRTDFIYWYDFREEWWHKIKIGKLSKKDLERYDGHPLCTGATGACPREGLGGPRGYAHFLENINDPNGAEGKKLREEWGMKPGEQFKPEAMSLDLINGRLRGLVNSEDWTDSDIYYAF